MIHKNAIFFIIMFIVLILCFNPSTLFSRVWWEDSGRTFDYDLADFSILILLGDDFDYHELMIIKKHWEDWRGKVDIAGSDEVLTGHLWNITEKGWEKTEFRKIKPDLLLPQVNIDKYQVLFLPGGDSPKNLIEKNGDLVKKIIQESNDKGLLLSAICHGPLALAAADVIREHEVTGHPEIIEDLKQVGGKYRKKVAIVDDNIITGNWPYFETFARVIAEKLLYGVENKKSKWSELESHPALKVIKERRSVRRYEDKDIDPFLIEEILHMASWAPSADNDQPWKFVIVKNKETKTQIFDLFIARMKNYYKKRGVPVDRIKSFWSGHFTAPVFIFAFIHSQKEETDGEFREIEKIWNIQSVSNACQNILLAAKAMKLGSCWMGALLVIESEIKNLLHIPEDVQLMTVIALGYPAEKPLPRPRKSLSEIAYYEQWGKGKKSE